MYGNFDIMLDRVLRVAHSMPPNTRHVTWPAWCPCLGADWCLRSDVITNSRLQAKLERLVELHLKYAARVNGCEQSIQQEIRELEVRLRRLLGAVVLLWLQGGGGAHLVKWGYHFN